MITAKIPEPKKDLGWIYEIIGVVIALCMAIGLLGVFFFHPLHLHPWTGIFSLGFTTTLFGVVIQCTSGIALASGKLFGFFIGIN